MDDVECGWISGIIDAEGTIALGLGRSSWNPKVAIDNTSKEIIGRFMRLTSVDRSFKVEGSGNKKPIFVVSLRHDEIVKLLKKIQQYLIIKRNHAELLLRAMYLLRFFKDPYGQARLSKIFWELRLLNSKGRDGVERVKSEMVNEMESIQSYEQFIQNNAPIQSFEESFKQWISPKHQRNINDINNGWMAGMIDGDGYISFRKNRSRHPTRPSKRGFKWGPIVQVDNTSKEALEHFMSLTGAGNIIPIKFGGGKTRKDIYRLTFQSGEILNLLNRIKGYLVKKPQAELLLESLDLIEDYESRGKRDPITKVRDKRLETIYWELKLLNARGMHGEDEVKAEMSKSGFATYSREEFDRDVKVAIDKLAERKYETHLRVSKEWKARNRERMHEYWRKWNEKKKKDTEYMERRREKARERAASQSPERQEYMRRWREKNRDKIREHNKQNWGETKAKLESDPDFAEAYRKEINERARRSRGAKQKSF